MYMARKAGAEAGVDYFGSCEPGSDSILGADDD